MFSGSFGTATRALLLRHLRGDDCSGAGFCRQGGCRRNWVEFRILLWFKVDSFMLSKDHIMLFGGCYAVYG